MTSTATPDPLLAIPSLPDGTRLLHIGPHKTGTTALQAAMWEARGAMLAQGVHPAGSYRNPVSAVRAVTAQPSSYTDRPPPMREWRALVREIEGAAEPHLVVSSEYFAHADGAAIRRIVADLDPARIQVAVTLRPLSRVIPSMWQQNVQAGQRGSLDRWLHQLFPDAPGASDANFWMLHRHHELVDRWAGVVGIERVTAVVVDDRDHAFVLRAFERLLGLRAGTLELVQDRTNRSLTWNEAEAVRAFNAAFRRAGLDRGLHARVMRYGAAQHLKRREPGGTEVPIRLPAWVADRVEAAATEIVAGIRASGVRVIGDLDLLTPAGTGSGGSPHPVAATPAIAATMSMGLLAAAGATRGGPAGPHGRAIRPNPRRPPRRRTRPSDCPPTWSPARSRRAGSRRPRSAGTSSGSGSGAGSVGGEARRPEARRAAGAVPASVAATRAPMPGMGILGPDPWRLPSSAWHPLPTSNPPSCPTAPG